MNILYSSSVTKKTIVSCILPFAVFLSPLLQALDTNRPAALADINAIKDDPVTTTLNYVAQFYPLWFTYYQSQFASTNRLVGPNRISPLYQIVVAINNDTLYASTFLDLSLGQSCLRSQRRAPRIPCSP